VLKSILFGDGEAPIRRLLRETPENFGYPARLAANGNETILAVGSA